MNGAGDGRSEAEIGFERTMKPSVKFIKDSDLDVYEKAQLLGER